MRPGIDKEVVEMAIKNENKTGPQAITRPTRSVGRRWLLKGLAATGAVAGIGPWVVRDARSSSGEIALLMRAYHLPKIFLDRFEKQTGIKVRFTSFGSDAELLAKVKATKGLGFDLVSPASPSAKHWEPLNLLQAFDMKKVPLDRVEPALLKVSTDNWMRGGDNYHLPYLWSTEALAWRTDKWTSKNGDLSYGDLWRPEMKGNVMGSAGSMMIGIGLFLDATGKLPSKRLLDTYKNEATMRKIWSEILKFAVERKSWVRLFWKDADSQTSGFMHNSVVLGQTWAGPPIRLKTGGKPVTYMAPKEGALSWIDGLSIPAGAKNIPQIYEFLKFAYQPSSGGLLGTNTGYNPVSKGASQYLTPATKQSVADAFPKDALDKLWWIPPEPIWYAAALAEFRDKFVAA